MTTSASLVRSAVMLASRSSTARNGAVVGTHAGPGTVGLFWYADDA